MIKIVIMHLCRDVNERGCATFDLTLYYLLTVTRIYDDPLPTYNPSTS